MKLCTYSTCAAWGWLKAHAAQEWEGGGQEGWMWQQPHSTYWIIFFDWQPHRIFCKEGARTRLLLLLLLLRGLQQLRGPWV